MAVHYYNFNKKKTTMQSNNTQTKTLKKFQAQILLVNLDP